MMDITTSADEPPIHLVPLVDAGLRRAVCEDCGAHAAVVAVGAAVTGACSVCGSARLLVLDAHLPPPRSWAR